MIDDILEFNKKFVESKGYEKGTYIRPDTSGLGHNK